MWSAAVFHGCSGPPSRYGSITFHDPSPQLRSDEGRALPITIAYESKKGGPDEKTTKLFGGKTDEELAQELLKQSPEERQSRTRSKTTIVTKELTPEQFGTLWTALENVGLFDLPEYPSPQPPHRAAYFLFKDTERRWIFVLPTDKNPELLSSEEIHHVRAWRKAKHVIASSWSEPNKFSKRGSSAQ